MRDWDDRIRVTQPDRSLPDRAEFHGLRTALLCLRPTARLVVTAVSTGASLFRHPDRPLFGVMFHPEVRNDPVVERFCV